MSEPIALPAQEVKNDTTSIPYPPSWIDRLNHWLDRLPIPVWLFYTLIGLALIFGFAGVEWQAGQYPVGTLYPLHVLIDGGICYALALVYYLDRYAHTVLTRFRPALIADAEQEALLRYRLSTLPARPTLYASLMGFGVGVLSLIVPESQRAQLYNYADTSISVVLYMVIYISLTTIAGAIIYHAFHQLRAINLIYTQHTRINLFHRRPLYALAWLSAFTALGFEVITFAGNVASPRVSGTVAFVQYATESPEVFLPIVVFVWPLLGIHRLMVAEKERLLDQNQTALEKAMHEIHQCASARQLDDVGQLNVLMESLETEARLLKQIPTWPWQPEVLRSLMATVLLPIIIWLAQEVLQHFVP